MNDCTLYHVQSGRLQVAHNENISGKHPALKLDKIRFQRGKALQKNRLWSGTTSRFQFQKQQQELPGERQLLWQKRQQEMGFQALTVKRLLMIWIIHRNWPGTETTTEILKALNNPDKNGGRRHQCPCSCVPGKCTSTWAWARVHSLYFSGSKMSLNWKWNKERRPSHPKAFRHKELNSFVLMVENCDRRLLYKPVAL